MALPFAVADLQNTHCATGVLSRRLAINHRAVAVEPLIKAVLLWQESFHEALQTGGWGDAETLFADPTHSRSDSAKTDLLAT